MSEKGNGPVYGVELIDALPLGAGSMLQEMPSAADLRDVIAKSRSGERVAAGYEVLLSHYRKALQRIEELALTAAEIHGEVKQLARFQAAGAGPWHSVDDPAVRPRPNARLLCWCGTYGYCTTATSEGRIVAPRGMEATHWAEFVPPVYPPPTGVVQTQHDGTAGTDDRQS